MGSKPRSWVESKPMRAPKETASRSPRADEATSTPERVLLRGTMARTHFTYATRKSALALAQCRALVARLQQLHPAFTFEELQVVTTGDRIQDRALSEIGGKGLFIKEIEEALLDGRADF